MIEPVKGKITDILYTGQGVAGTMPETVKEFPRKIVERKADVAAAREEVPREQVEKAAEKLNRLMGIIDRRMEFSIHEKSGRIMVKIVDQETGDVLNEIPPKKILDLLSSFRDLAGLLVDKRV